jgi:DNA-binding winged helix-turn-helix (wHTH) protein
LRSWPPGSAPLRRTRPAAAEPVLSFADLTLDQDAYEVRRGGRHIELSPTEFRLLRYFMLNPGRVLTRAQLLDHVWDYDFGGSSTVVSTYVTYLRRKLASDGPELIHTQRAVGYCLRLPRPGDEASPEEVRPAGPASGDRREVRAAGEAKGDGREVRAAGEAKGDDKRVSAVQASPDESQASSDES